MMPETGAASCPLSSSLYCSLAGPAGWTRVAEALGATSPLCYCWWPDSRELLTHGAD